MSKRTTLGLLNLALRKCNEPEVTTFVGVIDGTRAYQIYNQLVKAQGFLYNTNKGKWKFAEAKGTGTFLTTVNTYAFPTDCNMDSVYSFRVSNSNCKKPINYLEAGAFENAYPYLDPSLDTGYPNYYTKFAGVYEFDRYPSTAENTQKYYFRYWKFESAVNTSSDISTATASGATPTWTTRTLLLPEQFEELLTDIAAMYQFDFEEDKQGDKYRIYVFGGRINDKEIRGGINELKDMQSSVDKTNAGVDIIL